MPFQDKSLQRFKRGEVPCCQTSPDCKNLSKLAFICDKNGAPVVELLVLMFSGECQSICTVWPQVPLRGVANLCNPHGVCFWQFGQKYAHELPAGGTLAVYDPFLLTQKILILWLSWCPSTSLSCSPRATALLLVPLPHSCNCGATHKKTFLYIWIRHPGVQPVQPGFRGLSHVTTKRKTWQISVTELQGCSFQGS